MPLLASALFLACLGITLVNADDCLPAGFALETYLPLRTPSWNYSVPGTSCQAQCNYKHLDLVIYLNQPEDGDNFKRQSAAGQQWMDCKRQGGVAKLQHYARLTGDDSMPDVQRACHCVAIVEFKRFEAEWSEPKCKLDSITDALREDLKDGIGGPFATYTTIWRPTKLMGHASAYFSDKTVHCDHPGHWYTNVWSYASHVGSCHASYKPKYPMEPLTYINDWIRDYVAEEDGAFPFIDSEGKFGPCPHVWAWPWTKTAELKTEPW
jgi:hypothetical protein